MWEVYENQDAGNQKKRRRRSKHTSETGSDTSSEQHISNTSSVEEKHQNFTYTVAEYILLAGYLSGGQPEAPSSSEDWKVYTTQDSHTPSTCGVSPSAQPRPFLTQVRHVSFHYRYVASNNDSVCRRT